MGCYGVLWGVIRGIWRESPLTRQYLSTHTNMPPATQNPSHAVTRPLNAIHYPTHRHFPHTPRSARRRKSPPNKSPFN